MRRAARTIVVLVGALTCGCSSASHGGLSRPTDRIGTTRSTTAASTNQIGVFPLRPASLVVGPNGDLYIADDSRHQILERQHNGLFRVVAGSGVAGFGGDGSLATKAELRYPAGMTFGSDGTLYVADQMNDRVRAVSPSGMISTIAGNGMLSSLVPTGTPAATASFEPHDVKFGPDQRLYIVASDEVMRLESNHTLTRVVGGVSAGVAGIGGPAINASTDGADAIAFDHAGGFYLAGTDTKTLLYVTPAGTMTEPYPNSYFSPRGNAGMVTAPDGSVLAMDSQAVVQLTPHGEQTIATFAAPGRLDDVHNFQPNGIAVADDGTIYVDTWNGNGYSDAIALAKIAPKTRVPVLIWSRR